MDRWILPSLEEVLAVDDQALGTEKPATIERAQMLWQAAIATLEGLLADKIEMALDSAPPATTSHVTKLRGVLLSGPLPVLSHPVINQHFASLLLTLALGNSTAPAPFQLPPAQCEEVPLSPFTATLPLLANDPLNTEQFCLLLANEFSIVLVKHGNQFRFSFDPEQITQAWQVLRARVMLTGSQTHLQILDSYYQQFTPQAPDYRTVMQFSQKLLQHLPVIASPVQTCSASLSKRAATKVHFQTLKHSLEVETISHPAPGQDVELLQAIAHEVKTPLATIRTFTRLLLKRSDLPGDVIKRLQSIDRECSDQIDRFSLIFRAVELETQASEPQPMQLTATSLSQVLQESIPRWQKQANRRNLTLEVSLPQKMPVVVSDPTLLDQVLTGAIENYTSRLPVGALVQVEATLAGDRLKLQFQAQSLDTQPFAATHKPMLKSLGQLLMIQPETGILSLNMSATKNLFQAIGGKLTVRSRPQQGEVLTIFLPLK